MSSETLRREIERAQKQLFGNSHPLKRRREPTPDDDNHRGKESIKRMKTGSFAESAKSSRSLDHRNTTKVYGSAKRRQYDLFDEGNFQFNALSEDNGVNPQSESTSGEVKLSFGFSDSSEGARWDLPSSVRDDFVRNDPSMFPEGSSTVPDNTYDQQRMLETALTDQDSMPAPVLPVKDNSSSTGSSSIPWSAYLATQNKSQASQTQVPPIAEPKEHLVLPGPQAVEEATTAVILKPSHTPVGSPSHGGTLLCLNLPQNSVEPTLVHVTEPSPEFLSSSRSKKKRQREEHELTRSDELAIGLPKEQYRPRPSRSRSAQITSEPIDFSAVPEKAAKKKLKRAKTADSSAGPVQSPSSKNIQAMGEMGFTPNCARQALTESNGNLEEAIDGLLNRSISDTSPIRREQLEKSKEQTSNGKSVDEATLPNSGATDLEKQTRRELVAVEIPQMDPPVLQRRDAQYATSETYVTAQEGIVSRERSVDITEQTMTTSSKGISKKGKKRKAALHEVDHAHAPVHEVSSDLVTSHEMASDVVGESIADAALPEPRTERKRGRGRLRKATKDIDAEEPEEILPIPLDQPNQEEEAEILHEPLKEIDTNAKISSDTGSASSSKEDLKSTASPAESEPSPHLQSENAPEATRPTSTSKSSASQPPVTKGKAPYRVGLSRKARIAPLLKIVKK